MPGHPHKHGHAHIEGQAVLSERATVTVFSGANFKSAGDISAKGEKHIGVVSSVSFTSQAILVASGNIIFTSSTFLKSNALFTATGIGIIESGPVKIMSLSQQATTATIASGSSDTNAIALGNLTLVGISVPTLASNAAITIRVSSDGGTTFQGLFNGAGEVSLASSSGNVYYALNPNDMAGADFIKIRSGTNGSAVNQTQVGGTVFTLHLRETRV